MTMSLPVRDVLRSPFHYQQGRFRLAVCGLLIATRDDCRVIDDFGEEDDIDRAAGFRSVRPDPERGPPDDLSLRIDDPTFLPRLMVELPPVGSSEFLYFEAAVVCASTRLDPDEVVLHKVWSVALIRDGQLVWALKE